jgi:hypothetical protein
MVVPNLSIQPDPDDGGIAAGRQRGDVGNWTPLAGSRTEVELDPDEMAYYWLKAEIELAHLPPDLELVLDNRNYGEVFVNGLRLAGGRETTLWQDGNYAFPLHEYVFRGRNTVVLRCRPPWLYSKRVRGNFIHPYSVKPIVVRGSFSAYRQANGCCTLMPERGEIGTGAWEAQGYPDFCGSAIYHKTVKLPQVDGHYWLILDEVRHVAEVAINGSSVGVSLWQPHAFCITEALQEGKNNLDIQVTNSFGRLFQGRSQFEGATHQVVSGLLGRVWLVKTRA